MDRDGKPRRVRWSFAEIGGVVGGVVAGSGESSRPATTTTSRKNVVIISDYTGRSARNCRTSIDDGELVIEYRFDSSNPVWTATTRRRAPRDFGGPAIAPIFDMLQGVGVITSGELEQIDGKPARALVSPWTPLRSSEEPPALIGDPIPNLRGEAVPGEAVQRLWIDRSTVLPVRWEVTDGGATRPGFHFNYSSADIPLPSGVRGRDCVQ